MSNRVKEYRKQHQWRTVDLAEKSGVNATTINQIENGRGYPSAKTWKKLAKAFGVNVLTLQGERVDLHQLLDSIEPLYFDKWLLDQKTREFLIEILEK